MVCLRAQPKAAAHERADTGRGCRGRFPGRSLARRTGAASGWRLGWVCCCWGSLFHEEVAAAVHTWNISTAYNHCFLIIPIALYLLWDRRADLVGIAPRPMPAVLLLGLPLALIWLVAERLGIMEGRQLAALSFVELLFLAVLGKRLWWAMAGPLLYLYFLVPFGEFLTPRLQDITTWFIRHGLRCTGHSRLHRRLHHRDSAGHVLRGRGLRRAALPDRLDRVRLPLCADDVPRARCGAGCSSWFPSSCRSSPTASAALASSIWGICWAVPRRRRPIISSTAGYSSRSLFWC